VIFIVVIPLTLILHTNTNTEFIPSFSFVSQFAFEKSSVVVFAFDKTHTFIFKHTLRVAKQLRVEFYGQARSCVYFILRF